MIEYSTVEQQIEKLTLSGELGRHCSLYPQDQEYLNEVLNIRIKMPDGMLPTDKEE
jgi:hypothetical protein